VAFKKVLLVLFKNFFHESLEPTKRLPGPCGPVELDLLKVKIHWESRISTSEFSQALEGVLAVLGPGVNQMEQVAKDSSKRSDTNARSDKNGDLYLVNSCAGAP